MASAGPYANHLHLTPDRQPRQYLTTHVFYRPDALPTGRLQDSGHVTVTVVSVNPGLDCTLTESTADDDRSLHVCLCCSLLSGLRTAVHVCTAVARVHVSSTCLLARGNCRAASALLFHLFIDLVVGENAFLSDGSREM